MSFDPTSYEPEIARLIGGGDRLMPLSGGTCSAPEVLRSLRVSPSCLSGLYLYFDCLEESHRLSQDIHTADGSFWHAIMHRREPDPGNSGYWFRRVGAHPIFTELGRAASAAGYSAGGKWDPFAFIDYCEAARRRPGSAEEQLAMRVQSVEWQLLFDHCMRQLSPA